jgi:uroporphyrin-III C-methyltransferase/precorrin-2 dehydrogenase/sirohydrochlorin ferrochelatase
MDNERKPVEARATRMGPLARLPVFYALEGKRAVVAGGGAPSAWKAELLSAAGAKVDVYAAEPSEELLALIDEAPGAIVLHRRRWEPADLSGAAIAVGGCANDAEAAAFAAAARTAGVPVNVIDKPAFCDFAFGSIVNRSPLVIGVSTDGAAPVFAQAIRAKLEALIPAGFAEWAAAARRWRDKVKASGLSFAGRRRFWQVFTAFAVAHPDRPPASSDYENFFAQTKDEGAALESGSVKLVGAGPGDPELLTLRAVRALQSADIILVDDLVSTEVLDYARREAKKMLVGKTGYGPACKQDEINALMVSLAKSGKRVVRLKGGDPMIFGRGGEEVRACRAAGIPIEVVPGISAAQAVASRLGVSLTHRKHARRVQFVTGHAENGKLPADIAWKALADASATTAVYMPLRTIDDLVTRAVAAGLDPATPAVAVARATRPDEVIIAAPISELSAKLSAEAPSGPVLVLIGHVLAEQAAETTAEWMGKKKASC